MTVKQQMRTTFRAWLDHQKKVYDNADIELDEDMPMRSLPEFPTRKQVKDWVKELEG